MTRLGVWVHIVATFIAAATLVGCGSSGQSAAGSSGAAFSFPSDSSTCGTAQTTALQTPIGDIPVESFSGVQMVRSGSKLVLGFSTDMAAVGRGDIAADPFGTTNPFNRSPYDATFFNMFLARTDGTVLYQVGMQGGVQTVVLARGPGSTAENSPGIGLAGPFSDGVSTLTMRIPVADLPGLGSRFLWELVASGESDEETCPASSTGQSFLEAGSIAPGATSVQNRAFVRDNFALFPGSGGTAAPIPPTTTTASAPPASTAQSSGSSSDVAESTTTAPPDTVGSSYLPPDTVSPSIDTSPPATETPPTLDCSASSVGVAMTGTYSISPSNVEPDQNQPNLVKLTGTFSNPTAQRYAIFTIVLSLAYSDGSSDNLGITGLVDPSTNAQVTHVEVPARGSVAWEIDISTPAAKTPTKVTATAVSQSTCGEVTFVPPLVTNLVTAPWPS